MRAVVVVDHDEPRGRANAEALLDKYGVTVAEVRGLYESTWFPKPPNDSFDVVVSLGHKSNCVGEQVDVFYSTQFKPEDVGEGELWIWRDVTDAKPLTTEEASEILEWATQRGKSPEVRPRCLRRGMGQPTMAAIAVLCQVALADSAHELRQGRWWVATLGQTKDELLRQLDSEWTTRSIDDPRSAAVRAFVGKLFEPEPARLLETDIEACLAAVSEILRER